MGDDELEALRGGLFAEREMLAADQEVGFVGGEHMYDDVFSHERTVFGGGEVASFGLRVDTNRVPSEIKRAIAAQHASAAGENGSPRGSVARREMKAAVDDALREEARSGRHRRSKLVDLLWLSDERVLLCSAPTDSVVEALSAHWRAVMGGALEVRSSATLAWDWLTKQGRDRDFEDLMPTAFAEPPSAGLASVPEVRWAFGRGEPKDFLGNEFLLWLWFVCDAGEGEVEHDGDVTAVAFERVLDVECGWSVAGKISMSGHEGGIEPVRMPEAKMALALGKLPRKAGLTVARGGMQWSCVLQGDRWLVSSGAMMEPEEKFEHARELAEWRVDQTRELERTLRGLFLRFVELRTGGDWVGVRDRMRAWIAGQHGARARVVVEMKEGAGAEV